MPITIAYPKIIEFEDGTKLELTDDVWEKRLLLVETNRTENEVRAILQKEKFEKVEFREIIKTGQLGSGLIRKFGDWQVHIRLFSHNDHIQLDAEAELSNDYVEHLTHGWISAFKESWIIVERHFGELWVFHKGMGKYVISVVKEEILELAEPKSKTDVGLAIGVGMAGVLIATLVVLALKK